ncbi:MAG: restriction endonuclease subunit S [Rhodocyclaceae bacterium]
MSLPRYSEYKDSGVEWLGKIPTHWTVSQSRRMFKVRSEPALADDQMLTASQKYGVLLQADFVLREGRRVVEVIQGKESLKHVEPDDFIISMRSFQGGIEWCRLRGSTSFHYVMLIPVKWVCPAFFAHLLKSTPYIQALRRTTDLIRDGQELRFSNFAQVPLPVVPPDEQEAIATFLDRETAKIDVLIAEQEKLIALLAEKRQATISHAVTRGLNPDAPMKDSGVAWLGEVPAHWDVWKVRHAFAGIGSGTTPPSDEVKWYEDGSIPWVTTGELREEEIYMTSKMVTTEALQKFSSLRIHPKGSLAIAMYGATIGRLGILGVDAATNQACCVLSSPRSLNVKFVFYWLRAYKQQIIQQFATGGGQPNINQEIVAALRIPAPELNEQAEIAAFLNTETARLDVLEAQAEYSITLLKERRAALIAAAVTGQIDVRSAAPI